MNRNFSQNLGLLIEHYQVVYESYSMNRTFDGLVMTPKKLLAITYQVTLQLLCQQFHYHIDTLYMNYFATEKLVV